MCVHVDTYIYTYLRSCVLIDLSIHIHTPAALTG